jgi:methylthioribose-1-phosphate isomerase
MSIKPIEYHDGMVRMIDQRLLPSQELWLEYRDYRTVAEAIQTMVIRGAPAIGVAAAYGAAFGARDIDADNFEAFYVELEQVCATLAATRPTAVNLFWALDRMKAKARELSGHPLSEIKSALLSEAQTIADDDITINRTMGRHGAQLIADGARVLTHCNAGALATGGYGTALGVIRAAVESGKTLSVLADETRPFLQGSRLTAWELHKDGIPVTLICDNMAGSLMRQGEIDCVIVGADRIAANGDVANKIGTYSVAVLAKEHGLPFYVAAPLSTIDLKIPDGDHIPIEERDASEVTHCGQTQLAPEGIKVRNPAFDVTPATLVSAIITERGVVSGDYLTGLANLFKES